MYACICGAPSQNQKCKVNVHADGERERERERERETYLQCACTNIGAGSRHNLIDIGDEYDAHVHAVPLVCQISPKGKDNDFEYAFQQEDAIQEGVTEVKEPTFNRADAWPFQGKRDTGKENTAVDESLK